MNANNQLSNTNANYAGGLQMIIYAETSSVVRKIKDNLCVRGDRGVGW
nr:MAG TPA: hypothetical protein [Caudoviricetes sp.]